MRAIALLVLRVAPLHEFRDVTHPSPVIVDGVGVQRLPIRLTVRAGTRDLGAFLSSLSASSKRLFVVDAMAIKKTSAKSSDAECDLTLSFFSKG